MNKVASVSNKNHRQLFLRVVVLRFLVVILCGSVASAVAMETNAYFGGRDHEAYLDWVAQHGTEYTHQTFLSQASSTNSSQGGGVAVHWRINPTNERLHLAVAARTTGWLGFGFSETGGMQGSDVFYVQAMDDQSNTLDIMDAHVLEVRQPVVDVCQDWIWENSDATARLTVQDGFMMVQVTRLLDTLDSQDKALTIADGQVSDIPSRVIAAWGDTPRIGYHGNKWVSGTVRWYAPPSANSVMGDSNPDPFFEHTALSVSSKGSVVLLTDGYNVTHAIQETANSADGTFATSHEASFCFSHKELLAKGLPMTAPYLALSGVRVRVDERTKHLVHEISMYGYKTTQLSPCQKDEPGGTLVGGYLMHTWSKGGDQDLVLPDTVGIPLGDWTDVWTVRLTIQYSHSLETLLDSTPWVVDETTGVQLYWTTVPREHEMGIFTLGDTGEMLEGNSIGTGPTAHVLTCPSSCTANAMAQTATQQEETAFTVFRQSIRMHASGQSARTDQIRANEGVVRSSRVDYFNFEQHGSNMVIQQEPFQILPRDGLSLTCVYENDSDSNNLI